MENPWAFATWNVTHQGEFVKRYGVAAAERLAKQAGTSLGGMRPRDPSVKVVEREVFVIKGRKGDRGDPGASSSGSEPGTAVNVLYWSLVAGGYP